MRISKMKGKTLEELYGLEKSKEIKEKMKLKKIDYVPWNKGLKNIYSKMIYYLKDMDIIILN